MPRPIRNDDFAAEDPPSLRSTPPSQFSLTIPPLERTDVDLAVSREHRSDDVEGLEGVVIVSGGDEDMSSVIAMH